MATQEAGGVNPKRVVIAGLGDSGVLTAIRLAKHAPDVHVVGISAKPALVSGQELGWRISRPDHWAQHNWISFDRFQGLDRVRTVHGTLTGVDLADRTVAVQRDDGVDGARGVRRADHLDGRHQRILASADASSPPTRSAPSCAPRTTGWRPPRR